MMSLKGFLGGGNQDGPGKAMEDPVLVSGADGVGTKLELAFKLNKYDTVGIDCVAMCVNDILCHGARPLFFLDYLACGRLDSETAAALVQGVARGCRESLCVLLGGETAEMPGFYDEGKYDIAGFAVGIVDRKRIIDGTLIGEENVLVGVASSGPHSNGFSLIRRVLPDPAEDFGGMPLGRALLEPTRIYVKPILGLLERIPINGIAHITGGGFYENIPRMFPRGKTARGEGERAGTAFDARIKNDSWTIPPVFNRIAAGIAGLAERGAAAERAGAALVKNDMSLRKLMFNTFNMGIGLVLALDREHAAGAISRLDAEGYPAWEIGRAAPAEGGGPGRVLFI
jgi:phosphoribosylformylglycinamidine cyclo-ligase